ncbi:MAG: FAD-dependent oxidoreductase [Planctomycetes bacterium]|nr:FAD-dependent oxidoreductase [Planctomycetota bacterium]
MKICIVGGVAGGASAAARVRRLDEKAEIVLFERGEFISFANCGLPYHVGGAIPEREDLIVMSPKMFKERTAIDVRVHNEVLSIDREARELVVRDAEGKEYRESYDKLILSPGASPIKPPIPGADRNNVFQLWTIPDLDRIMARLDSGARRAVVVGAGFVGLEVAENLRERGLEVHVVEMLPQVLPTLDREMTFPLSQELISHGIGLHLESRVEAIEESGSGLQVKLAGHGAIAADFVILSIGVKPNNELAVAAGLEISDRGGIMVDDHLRTADANIYAVGDAISVRDMVLDSPAQIPLAGPANRQGRIAAENACGRDSVYKGSLGTSVVKIFNLTASSTGATERRLQQAGIDYEKVFIHPYNHAVYYPGATQLAIKLLYGKDGRILGAQCTGLDGVEKRIDVIATAMRGGMTVYDLEELELSYAPPYGSAKDPVNFAGMIAANSLRGDTIICHADEVPDDAVVLDVREPAELELGVFPKALNIPLGQLRDRLGGLPKDRKIISTCQVGLRGYLAERILRANGFDVANLVGGYKTWKAVNAPLPASEAAPAEDAAAESCAAPVAPSDVKVVQHLDLSRLQCPGPIVQLKKTLETMNAGEAVSLVSTPTFCSDLRAWSRSCGHQVIDERTENNQLHATVVKGNAMTTSTTGAVAGKPDSAAIVVFSGDLDKVMAAFIIATGMATLGMKVDLFFTFWGLNVLRKDNPPSVVKDFLSRMFGFMMPRGARKLALSKMHMAGMGTGMMKYVMKQKNVDSLPELMKKARELGVRFIACDMAMDVMGMKREELLDEVDEVAGVANFSVLAKESGTVLFI